MATRPPIPDLGDEGPRDASQGGASGPPPAASGPQRVEDRLETELAGAHALQAISTRLISESDQNSLYEQIVDAAIRLMGSDFASLQMADPGGRALTLLAWRNFHPESARQWHRIDMNSTTACGLALKRASRHVVPDVEADDLLVGTSTLDEYRRSGIRAVQSTLLVSRTGRAVGMISTHWRRPLDLRDGDFHLFDVLARQAADLIERAQTQQALRESEERLREADRRKDEFLATLAHELRNPLAPIRTGLELIRLASDRPETIEPVRQMMERQVGHMVRLIDDLLDVSRITSGKIRLQRTVAPLASLVQGAVEANRSFFEELRVELRVALPEETVWLDVDPTRFVQVVSNVLHNAAKFTEGGGRVVVSAGVEPAPQGSTLALHVADSGIGISPEMLNRVFELFAQGESPSSRAQTGLGIGLALSRRLVEMHGGTLQAESAGLGQGSTFTIRIPVAQPPDDARPPSAGAVQAEPGSRRVLIVDDNVDAALSLALLVETLGGRARVAHDGREAEAGAAEFRPELVLLDVGMPGLDGYETCRRLRRAVPSARIVAVTGWGQPQDREQAFQAGFDEHLTKPADPTAIRELMFKSSP